MLVRHVRRHHKLVYKNHLKAEAEAKLAENGRILLRASGTEPLVRVMVEASSDNLAQEIAANLAAVVKAELRS